MQLANHHAHTSFSDGKFTPDVYLSQALSLKMEVYGFTDHAPIPIDNFGAMSLAQLEAYLLTVDQLKEKYKGQIQILQGIRSRLYT